MKESLVIAAAILGSTLTGSAADDASLQSLEILSVDQGENAYVVEDGEATVNDDLIRRIAVGRERVTATYRNRTDEKKRARYTIELYNEFGLLLGAGSAGKAIFGGAGYIDPGDVGSERLHIQWLPLDRIFMKSTVTLPEAWKTVKWVVIKDTNTRSSAADEDSGL
jgi:hypothetical protein